MSLEKIQQDFELCLESLRRISECVSWKGFRKMLECVWKGFSRMSGYVKFLHDFRVCLQRFPQDVCIWFERFLQDVGVHTYRKFQCLLSAVCESGI